MFELKDHPCKVDFNPRAEKHGDENVPAGTITLITRVHSKVLDAFDPSYRTFLFRKAEAGGDQQPLLPGDDLIALAKPNLKTLVLDEDFPGYVIEISKGLGLKKPMRLGEAEISAFRIDTTRREIARIVWLMRTRLRDTVDEISLRQLGVPA